jgi:molecular chaperone GrpE (heat shock protein)
MTMDLLSFFNKRGDKQPSEVYKLSYEIKKLRKQINAVNEKVSGSSESMAALTSDMRKLALSQKETSLQLEEISELLSEPEDGAAVLVAALINTADQIENFYRLIYKDEASPLYKQAAMMWDAACRNLKQAGIRVIEGGDATVDLLLHSPAGTDWDERQPEGHILKTVASGYIYKNKVIRRASVIINKRSGTENDSGN